MYQKWLVALTSSTASTRTWRYPSRAFPGIAASQMGLKTISMRPKTPKRNMILSLKHLKGVENYMTDPLM